MISRRVIAAARRRLEEEPDSLAEVVIALAIDEAEDGDGDISPEHAVSLVWWWCVHGMGDA